MEISRKYTMVYDQTVSRLVSYKECYKADKLTDYVMGTGCVLAFNKSELYDRPNFVADTTFFFFFFLTIFISDVYIQ